MSHQVIVSPLALLLRSEKARLVFGQHGGVGYLTKLLKLQVRAWAWLQPIRRGNGPCLTITRARESRRGAMGTRSCCTS